MTNDLSNREFAEHARRQRGEPPKLPVSSTPLLDIRAFSPGLFRPPAPTLSDIKEAAARMPRVESAKVTRGVPGEVIVELRLRDPAPSIQSFTIRMDTA